MGFNKKHINMEHNLRIEPRATDYLMGDGHIQLKGVVTDWGSHFFFDDRQVLPDGNDSDCCWCFSSNKIFDAMMDVLLPTLPANVQQRISAWGFMQLSSVDNALHFHSEPHLISSLSGALQNGGTVPEYWDWFRKVGAIPYGILPLTSDMTLAEWDSYVIPQDILDIGTEFLALMGGKSFLQYHWCNNGGATDFPAMAAALPSGPLALGIPVNDAGWNQVCPTVTDGPPVHVVAMYGIQGGNTALIKDNYAPYSKQLLPGYQISYALQAVLNYVPPPAPPVQPPNPAIPPAPTPPSPSFPSSPTPIQVFEWEAFLLKLKNWLLGIK